MIVTFDSNVWQIAASPGDYPDEKSKVDFEKLNCAIREGRLTGRLAEVTFSLEGIKKADRLETLAKYCPSLFRKETAVGLDAVKLSLSIGPDLTAHPGNNEYLEKYLQHTSEQGIWIQGWEGSSGWMRGVDRIGHQ